MTQKSDATRTANVIICGSLDANSVVDIVTDIDEHL